MLPNVLQKTLQSSVLDFYTPGRITMETIITTFEFQKFLLGDGQSPPFLLQSDVAGTAPLPPALLVLLISHFPDKIKNLSVQEQS